MVKSLSIGFLGLALIFTVAYAGGSGNSVKPLKTTTEHLGVGGAFEFNYVSKRINDLDNKYGAKDMKIKKLSQVYGKVTVGLFDNFNVYGKIGGCNYDLEFVDKAQDASMTIDLENGIYAGAGINGYLPLTDWENFNIGIGADFQGNLFLNNVEGITRSGQTATAVDGSFYGLDGESSIYVTLDCEIKDIKTSVVPYLGVYHSWIVVGTAEPLTYETGKAGHVDDEDFQAAYDLLSFGLLLGMDLGITQYVNLNIEGRFMGETALTTGATIKF